MAVPVEKPKSPPPKPRDFFEVAWGERVAPALSAPCRYANPGTRDSGSPFGGRTFGWTPGLRGSAGTRKARVGAAQILVGFPGSPARGAGFPTWPTVRSERFGAPTRDLKADLRCLWEHSQGPRAHPHGPCALRSRSALRTGRGRPVAHPSSEHCCCSRPRLAALGRQGAGQLGQCRAAGPTGRAGRAPAGTRGAKRAQGPAASGHRTSVQSCRVKPSSAATPNSNPEGGRHGDGRRTWAGRGSPG